MHDARSKEDRAMSWARTDQMSERVKFVAAQLRCEDSFTDLCRDFGISRKTGYKWLRRYEADGDDADPTDDEKCYPCRRSNL